MGRMHAIYRIESAARAEVVGQVLDIEPAGNDQFDVRVGLALETVCDDAAQLINMLFGNSSLQPDVALVGVEWPDRLPTQPGPRFGVTGVRARLGVARGPLSCSALKPQGSSIETTADPEVAAFSRV